MTELEGRLFPGLLAVWTALSLPTFFALLRTAAPYGRHARTGWGPRFPAWLGWIVMEAPAPVLMFVFWSTGPRTGDTAALAFLGLWLGHYGYRAFLFPLLGRGKKAAMPVSIAASAFVFNLFNGYLNGRWLFALGPERGAAWIVDPRFVAGTLVFVAGFAVHVRSDVILRRLRRPDETGYGIPRGFLFEKVSCPNYLGEIVQWSGWALLTWSLPGLSFAIWTFANLAPRALSHHHWYQSRFPDYPRGRRALIPGLL
jgi:hypothetical protein